MIYNIYNTIYFFLNCVKEINNNSTCKNNSHNNSKYLYSKNHLIHKFVCIFLTKEEENRETRKTRNRYKERKEKKKKKRELFHTTCVVRSNDKYFHKMLKFHYRIIILIITSHVVNNCYNLNNKT